MAKFPNLFSLLELEVFCISPPETPASSAYGTALRRQTRSVARAVGPRHRRPRLRHCTRRRGAASAASGPRKARARVVTKVRQSAQPPADRSVQRLRPRHHRTAHAACWVARRCSGLPSARRLASPRYPQGATMCSYLWPAPVSASPCPGAAHGAAGLGRWLFPCLPSHGGFQLHRGAHRRSCIVKKFKRVALPAVMPRS
jgi:hypothetical protein